QCNCQYCIPSANPKKLSRDRRGERKMLWTITIILFILWIVGLVSSYTFGGWIHILLVLAIIVLIFNLMSGRRAV
ncbi:MAG: lmo0937 family membrane protein, partial [Edaphobacter sp.]